MAQLNTLPDGDVTDEALLAYVAKTSGATRNFKLTLQALFDRLGVRNMALQNKQMDGTNAIQTAALAERYVLARNILDNPYGVIAQHYSGGVLGGNITIGDGVYGADRWYALTQTGNVSATTLTNDGLHYWPRLTNIAGSAQRFGYAQIVEGTVAQGYRSRPMTLSGKVRCSVAGNIRYAILAWTGTFDSVTKDVVNNWTSTNFTTGNFFASTSLSLVAAGVQAVLANTVTDLAALTGTIPSNPTNVIVFCWTDAAIANGATLDMALQLEEGSAASPLGIKPIAQEMENCRRFLQLWGVDDNYSPIATGQCLSGTTARMFLQLHPVMRVAPTLTSPTSLALTTATGTVTALTGLTTDRMTTRAGFLTATIGASSLTAGNATLLMANNTTGGYLKLDAQL